MCISVPMPCPTYSSTMPYSPPDRTLASMACEMSVSRAAGPGVREPLPEPFLTHCEQPGRFGRNLADSYGERGIRVPALHDGAAVDRNYRTAAQPFGVAWDAMHNLLVHRGADGRGEPVVALERRDAARRADPLFGERVEIRGRHTRLRGGGQRLQRLGDKHAGLAHLGELRRGLELDRWPMTSPHGSPSVGIEVTCQCPPPLQRRAPACAAQFTNGRNAPMARTVTSSTGPVASMPSRIPSSA